MCAVGGAVEQVAQCAPLSSAGHEQIFVLDACDALKNGEGGEPGIGEPLCAFRQNNCVWEIECGGGMTYTGRIEPGDTTFEWQLATGTQCEGSFTEQGEFSGVCAVPDLFSCDLGSKAPEPGAEACPSAPIDQDVTSRGCGNGSGDRMACREIAWHGCEFMALCSFASMESLVFAGTASEDDDVGRLDFNGLPDWTCSVDEPTADALESDPYRASNEWIGQCQTAEGGLCRDNFDPATGEGFRGLQLFWGEVEEPRRIVVVPWHPRVNARARRSTTRGPQETPHVPARFDPRRHQALARTPVLRAPQQQGALHRSLVHHPLHHVRVFLVPYVFGRKPPAVAHFFSGKNGARRTPS